MPGVSQLTSAGRVRAPVARDATHHEADAENNPLRKSEITVTAAGLSN